MLDETTRDSIRYLALLKQKEQLEKEIKEMEKESQAAKLGVRPGRMNELKNYFKD